MDDTQKYADKIANLALEHEAKGYKRGLVRGAKEAEDEAAEWRERRDNLALAYDTDGTSRAAAKAETASLIAARLRHMAGE